MSDHPINPLVLIGVGSSFCLSALSCHFYRVKNEELRKLKVCVSLRNISTTHTQIKDLFVNNKQNVVITSHFRKYPFSSQINIC